MTQHEQLEKGFSVAALAAAPLVITFVLSSTLSITTTVTGDARQYATVSLVNGTVTLWSTTLTQFETTAKIPYDLVAGQMIIKKGGGFTLQIPTAGQNGAVTANLTVSTQFNPEGTPFTANVASWPLSS